LRLAVAVCAPVALVGCSSNGEPKQPQAIPAETTVATTTTTAPTTTAPNGLSVAQTYRELILIRVICMPAESRSFAIGTPASYPQTSNQS
jgi:uncharacterized lipoprotein